MLSIEGVVVYGAESARQVDQDIAIDAAGHVYTLHPPPEKFAHFIRVNRKSINLMDRQSLCRQMLSRHARTILEGEKEKTTLYMHMYWQNNSYGFDSYGAAS